MIMRFDNFDWHDSILNSVIINRQNLGLNDIVELDITWPSGERGIFSQDFLLLMFLSQNTSIYLYHYKYLRLK